MSDVVLPSYSTPEMSSAIAGAIPGPELVVFEKSAVQKLGDHVPVSLRFFGGLVSRPE